MATAPGRDSRIGRTQGPGRDSRIGGSANPGRDSRTGRASGPGTDSRSIRAGSAGHDSRSGRASATGKAVAVAAITVKMGDQRKKFNLTAETTLLGRGEDCAVQIAHDTVSRRHCRITRTFQGYLLTDLGGQNGTFVNGNRIKESALRDGDDLRVGDVEVGFSITSAAAPAPSSGRAGGDTRSFNVGGATKVGSLRQLQQGAPRKQGMPVWMPIAGGAGVLLLIVIIIIATAGGGDDKGGRNGGGSGGSGTGGSGGGAGRPAKPADQVLFEEAMDLEAQYRFEDSLKSLRDCAGNFASSSWGKQASKKIPDLELRLKKENEARPLYEALMERLENMKVVQKYDDAPQLKKDFSVFVGKYWGTSYAKKANEETDWLGRVANIKAVDIDGELFAEVKGRVNDFLNEKDFGSAIAELQGFINKAKDPPVREKAGALIEQTRVKANDEYERLRAEADGLASGGKKAEAKKLLEDAWPRFKNTPNYDQIKKRISELN
jgi:pSer/pThr/pTyr-binding forkhead associated (FHA) protein